ncbi:MAG: flippase-like domain-containing protein [Acetobacteraceae bacterium]|nr:flippase-like domain-containing protein [Acetobacteraceae bacterium]
MKAVPILLAVLGLLLATVMVGYFGLGDVLDTVTSIGWGGFALLAVWQCGLFVVLGSAWDVIVPRERSASRPWSFVWARTVRDSGSNCLPFSTMGGFVFGARALTLHGASWPVATASTVVDVTAEFLAQIAFAWIGLAILVRRAPDSTLAVPLAIALAVAVAACAGFVWTQRGAAPIVIRLGKRMAGEWFTETGDRIDAFQTELQHIYRRTRHVAAGASLHLIGWLCTGVAGWLAYRLLGSDIDVASVLALEGLLNITLGAAFLIPAAAGVQEAAYAAIGALFGLPPEMSLSVSLIRRAKDLAIGIPVLLFWQIIEMRRLRVAKQS